MSSLLLTHKVAKKKFIQKVEEAFIRFKEKYYNQRT